MFELTILIALLFSATFQKRVEKLAREVTEEPIRISVGHVGQANEDITQVITVLENESFKWNWLMKQLAGFCAGMIRENFCVCQFSCNSLLFDNMMTGGVTSW